MRMADLFSGAFAVFNFDNRSVIRGVYIPRALLISNIILGIIVTILIYNFYTHSESRFLPSYSYYYSYQYNNNQTSNNNTTRMMFFSGLALIQAFIIILLPAKISTVIIAEKEKENIDHFFLTKLSSFQLVIGKLLSAVGIYLIFFVSAIPVLAIMIAYTGGVSLEEFLTAVVIIIVNIVKMSAICIYLSVRIKKAGAAIIYSYISILMLFFILPSFFTKNTVFNELFYNGYPSIFENFIGVCISLIPLLIFIGFLVPEIYFIVRRKIESWKSYLLVSIVGVLLMIIFILNISMSHSQEGNVPFLNPIEFFLIFLYPDIFSIGYDYSTIKLKIYFQIFQYIVTALAASFAILYLAARRLDVLRWGKV